MQSSFKSQLSCHFIKSSLHLPPHHIHYIKCPCQVLLQCLLLLSIYSAHNYISRTCFQSLCNCISFNFSNNYSSMHLPILARSPMSPSYSMYFPTSHKLSGGLLTPGAPRSFQRGRKANGELGQFTRGPWFSAAAVSTPAMQYPCSLRCLPPPHKGTIASPDPHTGQSVAR